MQIQLKVDKENIHDKENITDELLDYMFTSKNIIRYTKNIIPMNYKDNNKLRDKRETGDKKELENKRETNKKNKTIIKSAKTVPLDMYKPLEKDSLFWCFYILKNGYSNYEMEINDKRFFIEKDEKFKYIEILRQNKDVLKMHKIKPLTEIEDDLANKQCIGIKTFFALCVFEKINVMLIDNRKIYEIICADTTTNPIRVIHRNSLTLEHHIELNMTDDILQRYRDNYYKISGFDNVLKAMSYYKVDELMELCKKLNICVSEDKDNKKKKTKKDIYELLVLNF